MKCRKRLTHDRGCASADGVDAPIRRCVRKRSCASGRALRALQTRCRQFRMGKLGQSTRPRHAHGEALTDTVDQSAGVQRLLSERLRGLIVDDMVVHRPVQIASFRVRKQARYLLRTFECLCETLFRYRQTCPEHKKCKQAGDDAGGHRQSVLNALRRRTSLPHG